jgi:hypothetical protein
MNVDDCGNERRGDNRRQHAAKGSWLSMTGPKI